ncbi:organic solute transporter Ostalpha-domain-containing protein [Mycena maculata]|uniref:Organic solute transporter Ostalpha-domain-containing protein n=1 Tax=Mycena maculata TaxID=230809 RepID=A0AAD7IZ78_9AGAR|nr:organic solute transporter Ostalpha-domain-containing protein [Mycena maculata]
MSCPSDNTVDVEQLNFWTSGGIDWDAHRIGWAIAGGCSVVTVLITIVSVLQHCRNYTVPREQRQVIRILYMPPVYAVISFFSYRYFRNYTYYSLIYVAYEAVTLSAFLLLIVEYVADTAAGHSAESAMARKDKRPLPIPFCCWRYRPTKAYFMYTVKWAVMQYVIVRPAISIAGIVCEAYGVLCPSESYNPRFASVYLSAADFVSITIALYGLLVFFGLVHEELAGRRPLAKFLCIKLIVMFTFYQSFVFSMLEGRVIKATEYWSEANIADGLNALTICIEMVLFALAMWWAYAPREYRKPGQPHTRIWRPLWDSINPTDLALEIVGSMRYFFGAALHHSASPSSGGAKMDFGQAFGVAPARKEAVVGEYESIGLAPYAFSAPGAAMGSGSPRSPRSPRTAGWESRERVGSASPRLGTGMGMGVGTPGGESPRTAGWANDSRERVYESEP